ncbi:hypothetical protein OAS95_04550 [Pelagibacteraceae bacterium]|jgi:hypothetical protein|nr:hypothetical protein [Pelagibacteraceae bacterium]
MSVLTNDERLNLKKMINESDCDDNTDNIRRLKHSVLMRDDIRKLDTLKNTHVDMKNNKNDDFIVLCQNECKFLYANYTDIFNKLVKDELDLTIMTKLLTVLKLIEDSKVDQHEGSVMVGKILKELYVDSATKRLENIDKEHEKEPMSEGKAISWKQFKQMK